MLFSIKNWRLKNRIEYSTLTSNFDVNYYKKQKIDLALADQELLDHYLSTGWKEGRNPNDWFSTNGYLLANPDVAHQKVNPLLHYLRYGQKEAREFTSPTEHAKVEALVAADFDTDLYLGEFSPESRPDDPINHYLLTGWREERDPNYWFSSTRYLKGNADVAAQGINPFLHYLQFGQFEGRRMSPPEISGHDETVLSQNFDAEFYLSLFDEINRPRDPFQHFQKIGWKEGRDPSDWFSTNYYLASNPDVKAAKINPFLHYLLNGRSENRLPSQPGNTSDASTRLVADGETATQAIFTEREKATAPGPGFEKFDPNIGAERSPKVKALAYYLPQFHSTPENDEFWGTGFTEWRNVARGQPRFVGHKQPSVPRDLGFYSLDDPNIMRQQIEMAAAAGLHGFCYYYYWFDGKRVLHKPVERLLADKTLDFPFALIWANENWTRTWDGMEQHVLLQQSYAPEKDADLVADLARHFEDPRYIRIIDRPLWFIYRPSQIPDTINTINRWRKLFYQNHGLEPLIMMAQGFGHEDPTEFGLDGAIEFPPHKLCVDLPLMNNNVKILDDQFSGQIMAYDDMVARADAEPPQSFPLIRTVTPHWDNESRRPGAGMVLHGSTPAKFEAWCRRSIVYAQSNPVHGEHFIAINAWNEWAESAYLEPDVHYGSAYLNALSKALHRPAIVKTAEPHKVVIVGHDAHPHGAQILVANMARLMKRQFGAQVVILLCGPGPMVPDYEDICETHVLDTDLSETQAVLDDLIARGFELAVANTTVSGRIVPLLKNAGFHTTSLIHELANLLRDYKLEAPAQKIAHSADRVIFPAAAVKNSFVDFAEPVKNVSEIRPQGLYQTSVLSQKRGDAGLRAKHGMPKNARIVVSVGFGDERKGIDRFVQAGFDLCRQDETVYFVWLGAISQELMPDILKGVDASPYAGRFVFPGLVDDVERWLAASDVFFLSAREDPFPSVVLEALAAGLPVVGYAETGGCDDLIAEFGTLVPKDDTTAIVSAISDFLAKPKAQTNKAARARRSEIASNYAFDDYCFNLATAGREPRISVIVPNYNYAHCLEERLLSIFAQSQPIFEIIVLDDASSDNSVNLIKAVAKEQNREIQLVVNKTNTGSPFTQWRAGLDRARGEYVWIAEADDIADPNFLKRLLKTMCEGNADFGFSDSWQVDEFSNRTGESYKGYVNAVDPGLFDTSFTMEGPAFLAKALAIKNVILNVSSVVFRKDVLLAAMKRCELDLARYSLVGDWRLYADICANGGKIAYQADALNGHRRHATSVTHALNAEKHMQEIEEIQKYTATQAKLGPKTIKAQLIHRNECRTHLGLSPE